MSRSLAANPGECGEEHDCTGAVCEWPEGHYGEIHGGRVETAWVQWHAEKWPSVPEPPSALEAKGDLP